MRKISRDTLPHLVNCLIHMAGRRWYTFWARLFTAWWGVSLGRGCFFYGLPNFRRHPGSRIIIADNCEFRSNNTSNLIGINHPCMISTLREGATIKIGANCGFSGTVIGCATRIVFGDNVQCGANTLITDTDWHTEDPRTGPDAPVTIEKGVWLGVNVTVLKGVTIGENTLVAAGSLVTHSLPANVVAGGVPAKVLKQIDVNQPGAKR
ncbi:MAG TPA: acyltransferase [Nitrospirota bacterium]|nr:acyltransferase [Nitrospirota bacterium]